jgi:hypothetical protein
MKRLTTIASLLFAGVVLGWCLRDLVPQDSRLQSQEPISSSNGRVVIPLTTSLPVAWDNADTNPLPLPEQAKPPQVEHFGRLLYQQEFDQAIGYYENAIEIDAGYEALLKPRLEKYLEASLHQCDDGVFVDLVDQWLDTYYEDISVLLLLAENQRFCNSPEESARTLQIARTYAVQPGLQESVTAAITNLVITTDKSLSEQQSWIELLGFYEFLQAIDLATNASQLR